MPVNEAKLVNVTPPRAPCANSAMAKAPNASSKARRLREKLCPPKRQVWPAKLARF
jgi:hypothetical protein